MNEYINSTAETDAKWDIDMGSRYPFDASDAWWLFEDSGDRPAAPDPGDYAVKAARGIINNFKGRRGIKQEFQIDRVDEDVRAEIIESVATIIREALRGGFPAPPADEQ